MQHFKVKNKVHKIVLYLSKPRYVVIGILSENYKAIMIFFIPIMPLGCNRQG